MKFCEFTKQSRFLSDIFEGSRKWHPYTAVLFAGFVFTMTIISMNLTTGLAIANIQDIVENAEYKKLALQEITFYNIYYFTRQSILGSM